MLTRTFTVETGADASAVAAYLADFRHHAQWRDDVISSELDSGDAGSDGAIYRQFVHQGPTTAWRSVQATVSDDRRHVEFHTLTSAPATASGEYDIEAGQAGTTVHCTVRITLHGGGRALRPIIQSKLSGRVEGYSRALSGQLAELQPGTPEQA